QALEISERRFREITENSRDVYWVIQPDTHEMLYLSPTFERIWGMPPRRAQAAGVAWLETVVPEDRARVSREYYAHIADGTWESEFRVVRPDGGLRWIRARGFKVIGDEGTLRTRVTGVFEDVTDRVTADRAQRIAHAVFRSAFDHALVGKALVTADGTITRVNEALCRLVGAEREGLTLRSLFS